MSAHRLPLDLSSSEWIENPDPGIGNTTAGKGKLPSDLQGVMRIISTASGNEARTLPNPFRSGLFLELVYWKQTSAVVVVVTASTKVNIAGNTVINLNNIDDSVLLISVPINTSGAPGSYRWQVVYNNGVTLA